MRTAGAAARPWRQRGDDREEMLGTYRLFIQLDMLGEE